MKTHDMNTNQAEVIKFIVGQVGRGISFAQAEELIYTILNQDNTIAV